MRSAIGMLPLFLPGLLIVVAVSAVLSPWVARRTGTRTSIAFLLAVSYGMILAATIPPDGAPANVEHLGCDLARIGPASPGTYLRLNETSLNVLLFVPLGIMLTLLPPSRARVMAVGAAIALPFVIETVQLTVPMLDRGCQMADLFDNLAGLTVGAVIGIVGHGVARRLRAAPKA